MDDQTLAAVAGAVAAWVAAIFAYRSAWVAKRQTQLLEASENRRIPRVTLELLKSLYRTTDTGDRLYGFAVLISNQSDSPNTITRCELELVLDGVPHQPRPILRAEQDARLAGALLDPITPVLLPYQLEPRAAVSGWLLFRVPRPLLTAGVDAHTLILRDAFGRDDRFEAVIVSEVINEEQVEDGSATD